MALASPYEILRQLDQRYRRNSSGLPVASGIIEDWLGIGFAIGETPLLIKMEDVNEILPIPATIRVPGVKSWVVGLANVRGSLMPVLDMNEYLYGTPSKISKASRILIINRDSLVAGLIVDEVFGLRRFKPEEHLREEARDAGSLASYLAGVFVDQVRRWNVFSVEKLIRTEQFLRVV